MTRQELIEEMVKQANQDGQERCIVELPSGNWEIKPIAYQGRGQRVFETIDTVEGRMSRQIGENFK